MHACKSPSHQRLMQVNPANGIVYATDVPGDVPDTATQPHFKGTHSAPWFLYQARSPAEGTAVRNAAS